MSPLDRFPNINILNRGHLPPIIWKYWGEQAYVVLKKKKKITDFPFCVSFYFHTPQIYHSSHIRRFFCHMKSSDSISSSSSLSEWLKISLLHFSTEPLQEASEQDCIWILWCSQCLLLQIGVAALFFSTVCSGTRYIYKNSLIKSQLAGSST